jgi:hypothetical protein
MKLYEVNLAIEQLIAQLDPDPETGEIRADMDEVVDQLSALQMERHSILEYLAKLVIDIRSDVAALKEEENRLKARREKYESKEKRLMQILDRECGGEKTDCGIATFSYRKTSRVEVSDAVAAIQYLMKYDHTDCVRMKDPEISKSDVKKLIQAGTEIPGCAIVEDYSCSLR